MKSLFHFAFNVTDLDEARRFYGGVLGCTEGRSTGTWVDFDFFGHQLSLHLGQPFKTELTGHVGDQLVPKEIEIDPPGGRAPLGTAETHAVERACGSDVVHRYREVEGCQHGCLGKDGQRRVKRGKIWCQRCGMKR